MREKGLTGSTLKLIAMASMLIDHIGLVIIGRMLAAGAWRDWNLTNAALYHAYTICRMLGRIAFPIFCFLLAEGFVHTRDVKKYALRLMIFALISEIPFDLVLKSKLWDFTYQNVFFTLAIGLVVLIAYQWVQTKAFPNRFWKYFFEILVIAAGMAAAEQLHTDYGAKGVLAIVMFYFLRGNRFYQTAGVGLLFMNKISALFAFFPILMYNGKRGIKMKWAFYLFYPLHLLMLFVICYFMGYAGFAVA